MKKSLRLLASVFVLAALIAPLLPVSQVAAFSLVTITSKPLHSADDARIYDAGGGTWLEYSLVSTGDVIGYGGAGIEGQGHGTRFPNVVVPNGAFIVSASITFTASVNYAGTPTRAVFIGEATDDASQFSTIADFKARRGTVIGGADDTNITTATVIWDTIGTWAANSTYVGPDISPVIQEIVDRVGWASGNAMAIWIDDFEKMSGDGMRRAYSYDLDPTKVEVLSITYSTDNPFALHNPYAEGGTGYKVQLHSHTTNSDGGDTPAALEAAYLGAGYSAIAITDHDFFTPDPVVSGMLWLGGTERSATGGHINGIGIDAGIAAAANQSVIDEIAAAGGISQVNHPNRIGNLWTNTELRLLQAFNLVEVWNSNGAVSLSEEKWDYVLTHSASNTYENHVWGTANDDHHGGAIPGNHAMVFAPSLTRANVIAALRSGNFYSSSGAIITVAATNTTITVTTPSASTIEFKKIYGSIVQSVAAATTSTYTITGNEFYVRAVVTRDSDGKQAWTQPFWLGLAPTVTTQAASGVSMNKDGVISGVFNGNVTSLGDASSIIRYFEYGLTVAYGSDTVHVVSGLGAYTGSIPTLTPGATYHSRATIDGYGNSVGSDQPFTLTMPTVATSTATISGANITLRGAVSNMGVASSTYVRFQWAYTSGAYTNSTAWQTKTDATAFSQQIAADPSQRVYYRVQVMNGATTVSSAETSYLAGTPIAQAQGITNLFPLLFLAIAIGMFAVAMTTESFTIPGIIAAVIFIYLSLTGLASVQSAVSSLWGG